MSAAQTCTITQEFPQQPDLAVMPVGSQRTLTDHPQQNLGQRSSREAPTPLSAEVVENRPFAGVQAFQHHWNNPCSNMWKFGTVLLAFLNVGTIDILDSDLSH